MAVSTFPPIPYENPFWSVHELETIQRCALSVALVKVQHIRQGIAEYEETGTAWLIAPGLAVTCWHVVATLENPQQPVRTVQEVIQQINNLQLYFGQTDSSGGGLAYRIQALEYPQQNVPTHDFAVLRIEDRSDHPYQQFAYLSIERDTAFTRQTRLSILQHPWGEHQQGTHGSCVAYSETHHAIRYTTETRPGTSGSPVFSRDNWFVTAIHAKRIESTNLGEGIHMSTLLAILQKEQPRLYQEIMHVQFPGKHLPGLLGLSPHNHPTTLERKPPEASRKLSLLATKKSAYQAFPHSYTNRID
ncbi:MAG: trypsin-like serine peptidase, partial [Ktedonobacteraceae bacterium]